MNNITEIELSKLVHHPQNPRKDLGDLTELTDSIKASGIMQNLTVVPESDHYLVVIGNRRMEAAKLAGLDTAPCAVVDMTPAEQLSTMMVENMQRSDLTIFEQAQGFQLMMDMGDTVDGIAEKTGFSKSTVRRRVKLMELDQDVLKRVSTERQISIGDFEQLNKISDIKTRNRLLSLAGTGRFYYEVNAAIENEKRLSRLNEVEKMLADHGCRRHEKNDGMMFECSFFITDDNISAEKKRIIKKYGNISALSYEVSAAGSIYFYRERSENDSSEAEKQARERARLEHCSEIARNANHRLWLKRLTFIRNYKESAAKEHVIAISKYLALTRFDGYWSNNLINLRLIMGINEEVPDETAAARIEMEALATPFRLLLWSVYEQMGDCYDEHGYIEVNMSGAPFYKDFNAREGLDMIYQFLFELGYEKDEEEKRLADGTSTLYDQENPVWSMEEEKKPVPIEEFELSVRMFNALKRAGIKNSEQLVAAAADGSLFNHVNRKYDELKKQVAKFGIMLPDMPEESAPGGIRETSEIREETDDEED